MATNKLESKNRLGSDLTSHTQSVKNLLSPQSSVKKVENGSIVKIPGSARHKQAASF